MITENVATDNLIRSIDDARQLFESRFVELSSKAKHIFRDYKPEARDEAVANVLADTWEQFVSLVERALANDTLLTTTFHFACKRTRSGRQSGKVKNSAYKELFNHAKRVSDLPMDAFVSDRVGVYEAVQFRVDTADWLDQLPENHRNRAIDLASGESPSDLASRWCVSRAAVTGEKRYLESSYAEFMSIPE
jgi:hypothetical protein